VSVWSDFYPELSLEEAAKKFLSVGYHHTELSLVHLYKLKERGCGEKEMARIRKTLQDMDFVVPQGHLSFTKGLCCEEAVEDLKQELDLFAALGIESAVLHFNGGKDLCEEARMARRLESVRVLRDHAKGSGVTICLENLGSVPETHTVQQLNAIIDAVGGDLGICLDTGHLHLTNGRGETQQSQREFILGAGERLKAMHITENNGKNDVHQMPYSARTGIDWPQVMAAVKEIGYRGLFNLEILGENKAPMAIRDAKLRFIKEMTDYMLSDRYLEEAAAQQ
jgi:sugar phosphate isomerase/epimerase